MIPDRYTLRAWAREGVIGLADQLYVAQTWLYEVIGWERPEDLGALGEVLYDDGEVRLVYAPASLPTGSPYLLRVKLGARSWTEVTVSAAQLQQLTRRFNDHEVTLVFERLAGPGEGLPWDDFEDAVRSF
jgi:hypothetical protein